MNNMYYFCLLNAIVLGVHILTALIRQHHCISNETISMNNCTFQFDYSWADTLTNIFVTTEQHSVIDECILRNFSHMGF